MATPDQKAFSYQDGQAQLPCADHPFWQQFKQPGMQVVVNHIITSNSPSETTTPLQRATGFLRQLTQEASPQTLGHAASNQLKPCSNLDLDSLGRSLKVITSGGNPATIPGRDLEALLTAGIAVTGQMLDFYAKQENVSPQNVFNEIFKPKS